MHACMHSRAAYASIWRSSFVFDCVATHIHTCTHVFMYVCLYTWCGSLPVLHNIYIYIYIYIYMTLRLWSQTNLTVTFWKKGIGPDPTRSYVHIYIHTYIHTYMLMYSESSQKLILRKTYSCSFYTTTSSQKEHGLRSSRQILFDVRYMRSFQQYITVKKLLGLRSSRRIFCRWRRLPAL